MSRRETRSTAKRKKDLEKSQKLDKQKDITDLFAKSKAEELAAAVREGLMKMVTKEPTEQTTAIDPTLQVLSHKLDQMLSRMSQVPWLICKPL